MLNCSAQTIVFERLSSDATSTNHPVDFISPTPLPSVAMIASGRDQLRKHAASFYIDPGGTVISGLVHRGSSAVGICHRILAVMWPLGVFYQVMNPSGAEWPGWVRSPTAMECIDWMQCYSNQSVTANEWLQPAPKQQQRTGGDGQDAASLSWWNGRQGLIKFDIPAFRWEADHSVREGGFVSWFHF